MIFGRRKSEEEEKELEDELHRMIEESAASKAAEEEPDVESTIEFLSSIVNPSEAVQKTYPLHTRELVLGNIDDRDKWIIGDHLEFAHFLDLIGIDGKAFRERAFNTLALSRSRFGFQQKQLTKKTIEVAKPEKEKKGWGWR